MFFWENMILKRSPLIFLNNKLSIFARCKQAEERVADNDSDFLFAGFFVGLEKSSIFAE